MSIASPGVMRSFSRCSEFIAALVVLIAHAALGHEGQRVVVQSDGKQHEFLIDKKLGAGGFSTTYEGRNVATNEKVAIKILHSELLEKRYDTSSFEKEHSILSAVVGKHRALPRSFGIGKVEDGTPAMVMELIHGKTLGSWTGETAQRPPGKSIRIALELLGATEALHRAGKRHNDIHPGNIMIDNEQSISTKLVDMGNASSSTDRFDHKGTYYLAPEQAAGGPGTHGRINNDIYSVGKVLIEMLTGKKTNDLNEVPPLTQLVNGRAVRLHDVLAKATMPDPAKRYQTDAEFAAALRPFSLHNP